MSKLNSRPSLIKPDPEKPTEYKCVTCGKVYKKLDGNFPSSQSPIYAKNDYHLPVCKSCIDKLYSHYCDVLGNEDDAIRRICMKFDVYYCQSMADASRKISIDRSRINGYFSKSNLIQFKDKTYDNTIDEESKDVIETMDDIDSENNNSISKATVKTWGLGFSAEDYQYLNTQYDDWRAKCVIDSKSKESLVREYCVLKLQQNKALIANKIDLYNKLIDTAQKTLDRASLTPKVEEASDKLSEKPMGVMIEMFEKERPIPEPVLS